MLYVVQPSQLEAVDKALLCKVHKALYGIKHALLEMFSNVTHLYSY